MSLEQHIEYAKYTHSVNGKYHISQKLQHATWWTVASVLDWWSGNPGFKITPCYDFSSCTEEEQKILDEIGRQKEQMMRDFLLDKKDQPLPSLPGWSSQYIVGYSVEHEYQNYDGIVDVWLNWMPQIEHSGPFSDRETRVTITSRLDLSHLAPTGVSSTTHEIRGLLSEQARLLQYEKNLQFSGSIRDLKYNQYNITSLEERLTELRIKEWTEVGIKDVVYVWKKTILVTPESYREACETLGIEVWSSYALAHKGYIRRLALYHPDKIMAQVLQAIPAKPKKVSLSSESWSEIKSLFQKFVAWEVSLDVLKEARKKYIRDEIGCIEVWVGGSVRFLKAELEQNPIDTDEMERFLSAFSPEFIAWLRTTYYWADGKIWDMPWFTKTVQSEYLSTKHYGATLDEFYEICDNFEVECKAWDALRDQKTEAIWAIYAKNRDILMEAWAIFQTYAGMSWEETKDIDILYGTMRWWDDSVDFYHALMLDKTDVMIAKRFLRKRWLLWKSSDRYNYDSWNMIYTESIFQRIYIHFKGKMPEGLEYLVTLLEDERIFDQDKIQAQAKILRAASFEKPEGFDSMMDSIGEYPENYSESFIEYEFEPTLRFGKGYTWQYGMYPQDYGISLWRIFAHIYANTTGTIPYRIGEKFIRKYIPESTPHDVVNILEQIVQWIPWNEIIELWTSEYDREIEKLHNTESSNPEDTIEKSQYPENDKRWIQINTLQRKIQKCEKLSEAIWEIQSWLSIRLHNCIGDGYEDTQIWLEIARDGWLSIYFPIMPHREYRWKLDAIYFSPKEVATMYLAMLESPILDSMNELWWRLSYKS